jgi:hypothetical protein
MAVLAAAWPAAGGGEARLAGRVEFPFVRRRLAALGVAVLPRAEPLGAAAVVVVDSYDPDTRRFGARRAGARLRVLVDDLGGWVPEGFDLIWNPNAYATAALYPEFRGTVLGGERAVPIRSGLPAWSGGAAQSVAVTLGGGRPTSALVEALGHLARALPDRSFRGVGDWLPDGWLAVDPDRPWDGLAQAAVLISAAGGSIWEAASVRMPVVAVCTSDNQAEVWAWARQAGAPAVDARMSASPRDLAEELQRALPGARPLPPLRDGAPDVARTLVERARAGRPSA